MAAASEVIPRVKLFYLKRRLLSKAKELKELFTAPPTNNKFGLLSQNRLNDASIQLLSFTNLTAMMRDKVSGPQTEVVVILGHSNVFSFESLAISDILEALSNLTPSFVVFLGCCGGNPRYGPLTMLSQLPEWQYTVFSFFQRRMYIEELCQTSPVLAIQYYLHIKREMITVNSEKDYIKFAFGYAKSDSKFDYEKDIAFTLNDHDEMQTAQKLLKMAQTPASGVPLLTEEIPMSCWQLTMFHVFTADQDGEKAIEDVIAKTEKELQSLPMQTVEQNNVEVKKKILIAELDEKCKDELKRRKLYNIIELACELQLLQVTKETFIKLRNNKWRDVDHLQFFVAMLQGYWGKNDYEDLREYATYHLVEIIKSTDICNKNELREYQLCCVGYCLFSPETYIITDESNEFNKKFGICLWRGKDKKIPYDSIITIRGYECVNNCKLAKLPQPTTDSITVLPPKDDELPWVNVFDLCKEDDCFVELYNKPVQGDEPEENYYPMHSFQRDDCDCSNGKCFYEYERKDLMVALEALQDYGHAEEDLFNCKSPSCDCQAQNVSNKFRLKCLYDIKYFHNKENRGAGHMQCFPKKHENIKFIEMRVVHVDKKLKNVDIDNDEHLQNKELVRKHRDNWKKVSRCRFIFACYCTYKKGQPSGLKGIFFFTDSHYGEDKIPAERIESKLKEKEVNFNGWNYFQKVDKMIEVYKLDKSILYDLQEELVKAENYYPFIQSGGLTIKRAGTPTLEKIKEKKEKL